jgi:hypothetical protein
MTSAIETWRPWVTYERKRGCGYRKLGGLYLVGASSTTDCGRLPLPLVVCPTCRGGIKPARGWTWIDPGKLAAEATPCSTAECAPSGCPLGATARIERAGLIWVGEEHYATPAEFLREACQMGISRRVAALPRDLEIGKTWCFLAHRKVFPGGEGPNGEPTGPVGGLFAAFVVERVERIVPDTVSREECEALRERGIQPVIARRAL